MACIVVVVLVTLGGVILSRSISENTLADNYLRGSQAFWGAEAAIAAAQQQLEADWHDRDSSSGVPFGSFTPGITGTYDFDIFATDSLDNDLDSTELRIVAEGVVSGRSRTLEVIMEHVLPDIFEYAIVGVIKVELKPNTTVHGDIYVDGDAEVQVGASVVTNDDSVMPIDPNAYDANVYYTGASANILGIVEGSAIQVSEAVPLITFDWDDMKADADYEYASGTTLSGVLPDGVYYITGDVTLDNVSIDQGSIVAEGSVEIVNNFSNQEPVYGVPVIGSRDGTIEVSGTADVRGLVYSDGFGIELVAGSTMNIYGSIVGVSDDVELKSTLGQLNLYYKPEFLIGLPESIVDVLSWIEQLNPYTLKP